MIANSLFVVGSRFARLSGLLALMALSGCAVDAAVDCNTICTRYKDCFDGNYDVAACASRCRDRSAATNDGANDRNRCEACINDRACASATFSCSGDCGEIVP